MQLILYLILDFALILPPAPVPNNMKNEIDGNKHEEVHADDHASTSSSLGQSSVNHILLCEEMTGKCTVPVAFSQQLAPAPNNLQNDLDNNIPEENCCDLGFSILCCDNNDFLGNEASILNAVQKYLCLTKAIDASKCGNAVLVWKYNLQHNEWFSPCCVGRFPGTKQKTSYGPCLSEQKNHKDMHPWLYTEVTGMSYGVKTTSADDASNIFPSNNALTNFMRCTLNHWSLVAMHQMKFIII